MTESNKVHDDGGPLVEDISAWEARQPDMVSTLRGWHKSQKMPGVFPDLWPDAQCLEGFSSLDYMKLPRTYRFTNDLGLMKIKIERQNNTFNDN